ncbi:MAG: TPMT family class I SAM-dependent methyltransferase [Elainella sp. Prado103]|jgi:SAM-dependent methyltransferase|nr:TPMT family class I SAM-dependent methyltransferase [Elainella sp. Prado103]
MSHSLSSPNLTAEFWQGRYQEGTDRWDLGQPAPPFVSLLTADQAPAPGSMAVLGSGRGHDALLFAAHGFAVTGFDFAPFAIETATQAAQQRGLPAQFLCRDIFTLAEEFSHQFDYVLEHTCFCAILPEQRADYVQMVHQILRPGGELIALFWAHSRPGGPPFGVSLAEIRQLFEGNEGNEGNEGHEGCEPRQLIAPQIDPPSRKFAVIAMQVSENSVESRRHEEYLVRLRAV